MRILPGLVLTAISSVLVACSLNGVDHGARIVVRIEDRSDGPGARLAPAPFASTTPPPSVVSGFDCIGVNVTGPGIPDTSMNPEPNLGGIFDDLIQRRSYCTYRGLLAGPISTQIAGAQEISLLVPPGSPRLVQLIGLKERNGSNDCYREFLNLPEPSPGPSGKVEADAFEIGRAVVNLYGDTTVSINADWSGLSAADQLAREIKCHDDMNGPGPAPITVNAGPPLVTARGDPAVFLDTRVMPARIWVAGGGVAAERLDFGAGNWTPIAAIPSPVAVPVLTGASSSDVLAIGGLPSPGNYFVYNSALNSWGASINSPITVAYSSVVHHSNGKTYIVGGSSGTAAMSTFGEVTVGGSAPAGGNVLTTQRMRTATVELATGKILVVGGATGSGTASTASCEIVDPSTASANSCATYPIAIQDGALVPDPITGGAIYVGGYTSSGSAYNSAVSSTDSTASAWTNRAAMSVGRSQFAAFLGANHQRIIAIGGKTGSTTATATTEIYDLATDTWSPGPSLATARYGFGAVQLGSIIYVIGGYSATGTALNSVEIINGF